MNSQWIENEYQTWFGVAEIIDMPDLVLIEICKHITWNEIRDLARALLPVTVRIYHISQIRILYINSHIPRIRKLFTATGNKITARPFSCAHEGCTVSFQARAALAFHHASYHGPRGTENLRKPSSHERSLYINMCKFL